MAEALLSRIVPPVSTPFGHPVVNEHYYTQDEELSGTANGAPEKITALRYLNQYVDDITAQRLAKERAESAQQQRTASQTAVNAQGLPIRGLPQGVQSVPRPVDSRSTNQSSSRSATVQSTRPPSAQQILDGLGKMSQSQPKHRNVAPPPRAAVVPNYHRPPTYPDASEPLDLNDPYVMESSPSKGRSSQTHSSSRLNVNGASGRTPTALPPSSRVSSSTQKAKLPQINDGFRSPEVSDGEEEDDSEDAEGELEEEDGDTYTPGNTRGQTVIDSGRPEKINGSVRSSVRPSGTKVGQYYMSSCNSLPLTRRTSWLRIADHAHRLKELVEDIFDAENSAPRDIREEDVSGTEFFSRTMPTDDGSRRLVLSRSTLEKLANSVTKALPRSSQRKSGMTAAASDLSIGYAGAPSMTSTTKSSAKQQSSDGLRDWEDEDISRLFRLLKRNMLDAEAARPFPHDQFDMRKAETSAPHAVTPSPAKGKPAKKKTKISPSKTKTINIDLDEAKVAKLQLALRKLGEGVMAARICLSILATGDLPKQVRETCLRRRLCLTAFLHSCIPRTCS